MMGRGRGGGGDYVREVCKSISIYTQQTRDKNVVLMLVHRLPRWPNLKIALVSCLLGSQSLRGPHPVVFYIDW